MMLNKSVKERIVFLASSFLLTLSSHAFPPPLKALGPWKVLVIDAQTKQPLQGVTVIVLWQKHRSDVNGVAAVQPEQLTTDKDGQFVIKGGESVASDPTALVGLEFHFFKHGYDRWRLEGEDGASRVDGRNRKLRYPFDANEMVIELVPRKTLEESFTFYKGPGRAGSNRLLEGPDEVECVSLGNEEWRGRLIPWVPEDDESIRCPIDRIKQEIWSLTE
ncbi:MAG: hypothetical protein HY695_30195 [Deltaproteobacteria bacterium]|nr:hypothetical protein [Deltaproteobacteria bacterium]